MEGPRADPLGNVWLRSEAYVDGVFWTAQGPKPGLRIMQRPCVGNEARAHTLLIGVVGPNLMKYSD